MTQTSLGCVACPMLVVCFLSCTPMREQCQHPEHVSSHPAVSVMGVGWLHTQGDSKVGSANPDLL